MRTHASGPPASTPPPHAGAQDQRPAMQEQLVATDSPAHVIVAGQSNRVSLQEAPSAIEDGLGHAGQSND